MFATGDPTGFKSNIETQSQIKRHVNMFATGDPTGFKSNIETQCCELVNINFITY